jgi:hypothetical protein
MMVEANNFTDRSYELVEKIERRRILLSAIVVMCFILAPIGLGTNAYFIIVASHMKGYWSDANINIALTGMGIGMEVILNIAHMGVIFAISAILIAIGIRKYIVLKDLKSKLSQMQLLEETIYNEVLKSNMHQLE